MAGEHVPANASELLELDTELLKLDLRLLELEDDENKLSTLEDELLLDKDELDTELLELDLRLLELEDDEDKLSTLEDELLLDKDELLTTELELLKLDLILLILELALLRLDSELAELITTDVLATELLLIALRLDELTKLLVDDAAEETSTRTSLDTEDCATLAAELTAVTEAAAALMTGAALATNGLALLGASPPPPPQAFNKATASQPRPNVNTRENLQGCISRLPALSTKAANSVLLKREHKRQGLPCTCTVIFSFMRNTKSA
jgi:hypothetical protein